MGICNFLMETSWLKWLGKLFGCGAAAVYTPPVAPAPPAVPNIVWRINNGTISVAVDSRNGGAISSVIWKGIEFVNTTDHGREIQTAIQLDGSGEQNNPTEAGSAADSGGGTSSSRNLSVTTTSNSITTSNLMAYWYPVGGQTCSDIGLSKTVAIDGNVIRAEITIHNPRDHASSAIEGLTGYINAPFNTIAQTAPVIMSTPDGSAAMGAKGSAGAYFSFSMVSPDSNKWDAAWQSITPFPKGDYKWTVWIVVGTLADVRKRLNEPF